jgi:hypothetical protein
MEGRRWDEVCCSGCGESALWRRKAGARGSGKQNDGKTGFGWKPKGDVSLNPRLIFP